MSDESAAQSNGPPAIVPSPKPSTSESSLDASTLEATNAFQQLSVATSTLRPSDSLGLLSTTANKTAPTGSSQPNGVTATTTSGGSSIYPSASNTTSYSALLGNSPSAIVNNGLNPLTPPVVSMPPAAPSFTQGGVGGGISGMRNNQSAMSPAMSVGVTGNMIMSTTPMGVTGMQGAMTGMMPGGMQANGQPMPTGMAGQMGQMGQMGQNGQGYYMQQPVYIDHNGNPMYFRPGMGPNQQGQFVNPEFIPYQGMDGSGMGMGMGMGADPNHQLGMQNTFMPYDANQMPQNMQQNMPNGYWPNGQIDQNGQMTSGMGIPGMYPINGQQGMAGPNGQNPGQQRMVFNPATGQYVAQPTGVQGGVTDGRGPNGMQNMSAPYMNQPNGNPMMPNGMNQNPSNPNGGLPPLLPRAQFGTGAGGEGIGIGGMTVGDGMAANGMMMPTNGMNAMQNGGMNGMYPMMNPNIGGRDDTGGMGQMGRSNGADNGYSRGGNDARNRDGRDRDRDRDNYRNDRHDRGNRGNDRDRDRGGRNDRSNDRRDNRDRDRGGDRDRDRDRDSGANPVRDPLVEEFRSTYGKSRQWGLSDLVGHVVAFCQDQHGSRFIQQRLEVRR